MRSKEDQKEWDFVLERAKKYTNQTKRTCSFSQCNNPIHSKIRWGLKGSNQIASMCKKHVDELWKQMRTLCSAGLGHWTQIPADEDF